MKRERETEGEGEGQYLRHLSYYTEVEERVGVYVRGEKERNHPHQIEGNTYYRNHEAKCEAQDNHDKGGFLTSAKETPDTL